MTEKCIKDEVYAALEGSMLDYDDIAPIEAIDNGEPLVPIRSTPFLRVAPREDSREVTGEDVYVRASVALMLGRASMLLYRMDPSAALQVGFGYRSLSVQRRNFERVKENLVGTVPDEDLEKATHRYVAVPEIAGHPAGAAVDVNILRGGVPVDCGTKLWELTKDSYVLSPFVGREAQVNRRKLQGAMLGAGFAPFDGEWWHFSYGDKEWAAYYNRPNALYSQVGFSPASQPKI